MRKVVSYLLYSLDGVIEDPQDWVFDRFDDEMMGHLKALIDRQDAVLLGRRTYEEWAPYWPTSTHEPFASFINATPKYVVSTTLRQVSWANSSLVEGDAAQFVAGLKSAPGGEIGVHGSATLVRYLLRHSLLDELKLAVFPAVAGRGLRLFEDVDEAQLMHLADLKRTAQDVLVLTCQPVPGGRQRKRLDTRPRPLRTR
jgi:dihydrofolate reductase